MNQRQKELFSVDLRFVRILNDLIASGALAEMGSSAFAVLVVIRSLVPLDGISSFPSQETLAFYTGMSKKTVQRALKKLETLGWLEKIPVGRRTVYKPVEKVILRSTEPELREDQLATMPFGALAVSQGLRDVQQYAKRGVLPAGSPVHIQPVNITIQVNIGDNGTNLAVGSQSDHSVSFEDLADTLPPGMKEPFQRLLEASQAKPED